MNWFAQILLASILALALPPPAPAQQRVEVARADGAKTPLRVFAAQNAQGCPPLALLSHGAGASEDRNLPYLATALSDDGWRVIAIGHAESGSAPMRDDIRAAGFKQGLIDLVTDVHAYRARFMDIDAALAWSQAQCRAPFKALIGHSMGAITVMLAAGARHKLDVGKGDAKFARAIDAFVALSPEGPGVVFPDDAWQPIAAPMLLVTGTRDGGLGGDYTWRIRAFEGLGPGCRALAVVDRATHMNLGGLDPAHRVTSKVAPLVVQYLDGVRAGRCTQLIAPVGVMLRSK